MPLTLATLGDHGVGKTSLLKKLSGFRLSGDGKAGCCCAAFRPNEFVDLEFVRKNGRKIVVRILDTAGQERYRSLTASYFRGVQGCLLVFNVRQKESFDNILNWHSYMKKYTDTPVILIGLSTGRLESCDKREVTSERAFKLAEFLHTEFLETTLDDEEMISWIIAQTMEKALRHLDAHDGGRGRLTSITPSTKDSKKKPKKFSVCF